MDKKPLRNSRSQEPIDDFIKRFTASDPVDRRLYVEDISGSRAHARMLACQGIISEEDYNQIEAGLQAILGEIESGEFSWSVALEDVHINIEAALIERIGDAGKRLHTGRSRNDQVALDIRLWLRSQIKAVCRLLTRLQKGITELALLEADTLMPGFTHLQVAQPVTLGHHLLAWNEMLERDYGRFQDSLERLDQCPLGSAALAGTSFPIDRFMTAKELGFREPCRNSMDAVSDRDFAIEFCSAGSICMMHLSRIGEELILWASTTVKFIDLPDQFCTGSSIMPQKKNPDVLELVRGKSSRVAGHLTALLMLMKSQPLAYNKDNQEDKEALFDSADTLRDCLRAFAEMIPLISPDRATLRKAAESGYSVATDMADYLVLKGASFRNAHAIVGQLVRYAIEQKLSLPELDLSQLQSFSPLITADIYALLTPEGSVSSRDHIGGTAPRQVRKAGEEVLQGLLLRADQEVT